MTHSEKIKALKNSKPFKLMDIFIFGAAVVLIILIMFVSFRKPEGKFVAVRIDGKITDYYSLEEDGKFVIGGGRLCLIIEKGCAYVKDSRCPDHYCEKTGRIKLEGQQIICLPQEIVIEIVADIEGGPGDLVTG